MENEEVLVSAYANETVPDHETACSHVILQLFQGDRIWLHSQSAAIYGSSWKYFTFSGYFFFFIKIESRYTIDNKRMLFSLVGLKQKQSLTL